MTTPDPPGLEPLHTAYVQQVGLVRAAIQLFGLPTAMVEEIVLETFVMAHNRGEDLRAPAEAKAKLCVLALRVADGFREQVPADAPPVGYPVAGGAALARFLEALRERRREMFVLAELGGLRVAEISAEFGLSFDAVRAALFDLQRDFAAIIAESAEVGEVLALWVATCQPDPTALQFGWHRVVQRIAPTVLQAAPTAAGGWGKPPVASAVEAAPRPVAAQVLAPPVLATPVLGGAAAGPRLAAPGLNLPPPPAIGAPPVLGGPPKLGAPGLNLPPPPVLGRPPGVAPPAPLFGAPVAPPSAGQAGPGGMFQGAGPSGQVAAPGAGPFGAPQGAAPGVGAGPFGAPQGGAPGAGPFGAPQGMPGAGPAPFAAPQGGAPGAGPGPLGAPQGMPGAGPAPFAAPQGGAPGAGPAPQGASAGAPFGAPQGAGPGVPVGAGLAGLVGVPAGMGPAAPAAGGAFAGSAGAPGVGPGAGLADMSQPSGLASPLAGEHGRAGTVAFATRDMLPGSDLAGSVGPGAPASPAAAGASDMSQQPGPAAPLAAGLSDLSQQPGSGALAAGLSDLSQPPAPATPLAAGLSDLSQQPAPAPGLGDMSQAPGTPAVAELGALAPVPDFAPLLDPPVEEDEAPISGPVFAGNVGFGFPPPGPAAADAGFPPPSPAAAVFGFPPPGPLTPEPPPPEPVVAAPAKLPDLIPVSPDASVPGAPAIAPGVVAGPYGSPMAPASAGPLGAPVHAPPVSPQPARTFTDEGPGPGLSSTFDRPRMHRTSPAVYVGFVALVLGAGALWFFLGRDGAEPRDEVAVVDPARSDTAALVDPVTTPGETAAGGLPGATATTPGTAGDPTAAVAPGTPGTAAAATAGDAALPTPGLPGTPATPGAPTTDTADTKVPTPGKTTKPVGTKAGSKPAGSKPKTPDVRPKPTPTPTQDKLDARRDQAAKADPGRIIMELEYLSAAKKALKGNPNQTLAYIAQHDKEFPGSQLIDQFDELRIKALCALGRGAQARSEATAILKKRPTSRVGPAVKECPA